MRDFGHHRSAGIISVLLAAGHKNDIISPTLSHSEQDISTTTGLINRKSDKTFHDPHRIILYANDNGDIFLGVTARS